MIRLKDPSGRFVIGPHVTPYQTRLMVMGATSQLFGKDPKTGNHTRWRGVYVDNETPDRNVRSLEIRATVGKTALVVVGLYPNETGRDKPTIPGCILALQWYPYGFGYQFEPLPAAEAYITQWDYTAPGKPPPTPAQRRTLYQRALGKTPKPKLVWTY